MAWNWPSSVAGRRTSRSPRGRDIWLLGHTLADARHRPRLFLEFNRASGDRNAHDGEHDAFDPLFPASHDKLGAADQFSGTNLVHARPGFQYRVREGLTFAVAYNSFWLANGRDGYYSGGKLMIAADGSQGSHIGQEADIQAQWNPTRHTLVDFVFGHIIPGEFLRHSGRGSPYNGLALGITQRL